MVHIVRSDYEFIKWFPVKKLNILKSSKNECETFKLFKFITSQNNSLALRFERSWAVCKDWEYIQLIEVFNPFQTSVPFRYNIPLENVRKLEVFSHLNRCSNRTLKLNVIFCYEMLLSFIILWNYQITNHLHSHQLNGYNCHMAAIRAAGVCYVNWEVSISTYGYLKLFFGYHIDICVCVWIL